MAGSSKAMPRLAFSKRARRLLSWFFCRNCSPSRSGGYCYLVDGVALAVVLVPCVFQPAAYEHQVVLAEHLDTVAHDATSSVAMFNEVQLHLLVLVQGVGEGIFVAVHHEETVFLAKRCDLRNYFISHGIKNMYFYFLRRKITLFY